MEEVKAQLFGSTRGSCIRSQRSRGLSKSQSPDSGYVLLAIRDTLNPNLTIAAVVDPAKWHRLGGRRLISQRETVLCSSFTDVSIE